MKKLFKVFLVVALLLVQFLPILPVSAEETVTGTIKVGKAEAGATYTIYRILDLESYNNETEAYAYKVNDKWSAFVNSAEVKGVYLNVNEQGYVTWAGAPVGDDVKFVKLAGEYAKKNNIANDGTAVAQANTDLVFSNLPFGYYLLDSSIGAVCSISTTNPTATINAKNSVPTVVKTVQSDLNPDAYGLTNTAEIDKVFEFKSVIHAGNGAQNYILHDKMSKGLSFEGVTRVGLVKGSGTSETSEALVENVDYVVHTNTADGDTFEVDFSDALEARIASGYRIVVYYNAKANADAVIGREGNPNETYVSFGDESKHTSEKSSTKTYVYHFNLIKTGKSNAVIDGAKFVLYRDKEYKDVVRFSYDEETKTYTVDAEGEVTEIIAGSVKIVGFGMGTYHMVEVEAPEGYNKLSTEVLVEILEDGDLANHNTGMVEYSKDVIAVKNTTGALLPVTGGIGTVLFITVGSVMVLGFGVLLVTKLRLAKEM